LSKFTLDGIHHWSAYKECGCKKILAVEWKKEPINCQKGQIPLLLEAAKCNLTHGHRLKPRDKKRIARDIATSEPECKWTEEALAQRLGVIRQKVSNWQISERAKGSAGTSLSSD